jgi:CheY-like chemotaxis protein
MRRILFVDDDFAVAEVTRMVLEHEGFAVTIAANGEDALVAAETESFDLVITDYMMPIMNGGELVKRLRASPTLRRIPVIMASATSSNEIAEAEACDGLLAKPITVDTLLVAIRAILGD